MNIKDLVEKIRSDFNSNKFDKFIHEANFPKFKNFSPGAKINFRFPISVIVGPNGGGKSSILHAIWGMPHGCSTSRFWFSTPVDPIASAKGNQHRYWYTHYIKDINQRVQCRKVSGNKRNGYWEPSRPILGDGMEKMPDPTSQSAPFMSQSNDRWNQVHRTPFYINSKSESSAFERFFYHTNIDTLEEKQEHFLKYSRKLRHAIDTNSDDLSYYSKRRVFENYMISASLLKEINAILKKEYISARYIMHSLYGDIKSPSVIFETGKGKYSECFAGSGELAIVNTILALEKIKQFDLLLLDEPETSLHPGAQKKFLEYLLRTVKEKMVQVVISTHSPTFVELLPEESLIVLDDSPEGVYARSNPTKVGAFYRLGQPAPNKILLLAEDPLLAAFVELAQKRLPHELRENTDVEPATVGASEMLSNQVKAYSLSNSKVIMILDGDVSAAGEIANQDFSTLSAQDKKTLIADLKKMDVSLVGGESFLEQWASWCKDHVIFIDQICSEHLLLMCLDSSHKLLKDSTATNQKMKSAVRSYMTRISLDVDQKSMAATLKTILSTNSPEDSPQAIALNIFVKKLASAIQKIS